MNFVVAMEWRVGGDYERASPGWAPLLIGRVHTIQPLSAVIPPFYNNILGLTPFSFFPITVKAFFQT